VFCHTKWGAEHRTKTNLEVILITVVYVPRDLITNEPDDSLMKSYNLSTFAWCQEKLEVASMSKGLRNRQPQWHWNLTKHKLVGLCIDARSEHGSLAVHDSSAIV